MNDTLSTRDKRVAILNKLSDFQAEMQALGLVVRMEIADRQHPYKPLAVVEISERREGGKA